MTLKLVKNNCNGSIKIYSLVGKRSVKWERTQVRKYHFLVFFSFKGDLPSFNLTYSDNRLIVAFFMIPKFMLPILIALQMLCTH